MSRQNKILMVVTLLCGSFITAFSETLLPKCQFKLEKC